LGRFLEACCDAPKLFELAEAAFDEVSLSVEVTVDGMLAGARRVVRDDGLGSLLGDSLADVIGVVSRIGDHELGLSVLEKGGGLWGIAVLASGENEADRTAQAANRKMDFGG
jgi:hypothetical protein